MIFSIIILKYILLISIFSNIQHQQFQLFSWSWPFYNSTMHNESHCWITLQLLIELKGLKLIFKTVKMVDLFQLSIDLIIFVSKIYVRQTVRIFNSNLLSKIAVSENDVENKKCRKLLLVYTTYFRFFVALFVLQLLVFKVVACFLKNIFSNILQIFCCSFHSAAILDQSQCSSFIFSWNVKSRSRFIFIIILSPIDSLFSFSWTIIETTAWSKI